MHAHVISGGGDTTYPAEVTPISIHEVWILAHAKEMFMSYAEFPWFRDRTVESILNVEEASPRHFYWPQIDVVLRKEIIELPDRFLRKAECI